MNKVSLILVVLEDDHHKMLIYRFLTRCGLKSHQMRILASPSGTGSAESWVQKKFAEETIVYRSRQARTALIVMIDADTYSVQERLSQLDQALTEKGKRPPQSAERIARLIPKRNIETWILCLNGEQVNEATDYKRTTDTWTDLIPPAAEKLFRWTRPGFEILDSCVDSLRFGLGELRGIEL